MSLQGSLAPVSVERVGVREWRAACEREAHAGGRFCGLFASRGPRGLEVNCLFARADRDRLILAPLPARAVDTLLDVLAAAALDEREAHDLYGVRFRGHEPLRALVDHSAELCAWTVPIRGRDPHQVAVGPIHAGVIESGHFRFTVVGERILHLDLRLFYKHRGLQAAAEGRSLAGGLRYVQRACGACAVTNAVAYAQACESALGLAPDGHLRRARTLLLELERLYNHFNDVSAVCAGVGAAPASMAFAALKERAQRLNRRLAGHRFLFDTVALAGCSLSVGERDARAARLELRALRDEQRSLWRELRFAGSLQDRLDRVGRLSRQEAVRLGAVGPAARAAGVRRDARTESPRLHYHGFEPAAVARAGGDVAARVEIRREELEQTFDILDELLADRVMPGRVRRVSDAPSSFGMARVESPRGETVCVTRTDGRMLERVHLRTGSYANWPALARATRANLLPDFPLINKSFELCYACADR